MQFYKDSEKAAGFIWWEGTHRFIILLIMVVMAGWMTINSMIMINFELDQLPIPHMWQSMVTGLIICIFEAYKARRCQSELQELRFPFPQLPPTLEE